MAAEGRSDQPENQAQCKRECHRGADVQEWPADQAKQAAANGAGRKPGAGGGPRRAAARKRRGGREGTCLPGEWQRGLGQADRRPQGSVQEKDLFVCRWTIARFIVTILSFRILVL